MDHPKFSQFNVSTAAYKSVNEQEIPLWVLVPKGIHTGKRPVLVHFHGGYLISGHAMFPDWAGKHVPPPFEQQQLNTLTAQWALDYAIQNNAIMIRANYRLAPESNGLEILSDIRDALSWVEHSLPSHLKTVGSEITADYQHLAVYGESAGGYLAIQSGMMRPDLIKAIIAAYPMTYLDSPWYAVASTDKSPFGEPQVPREILDAFLAARVPGKIFTGSLPMDEKRDPMTMSTLQHGRFPEILGTDDEIYPGRVLAKISPDTKVPFLYVFHGTEDSAVPCGEAKQFVEAWKLKFGEEKGIGKFVPGEHGFDSETTLETEWMKEGLAEVAKAWIS